MLTNSVRHGFSGGEGRKQRAERRLDFTPLGGWVHTANACRLSSLSCVFSLFFPSERKCPVSRASPYPCMSSSLSFAPCSWTVGQSLLHPFSHLETFSSIVYSSLTSASFLLLPALFFVKGAACTKIDGDYTYQQPCILSFTFLSFALFF